MLMHLYLQDIELVCEKDRKRAFTILTSHGNGLLLQPPIVWPMEHTVDFVNYM